MKKKLMFLILTALISLTISAQAFAFSTSYDQKVSVNGNLVATIKVISQDDNLRAESDFRGMKSVMLRNKTGAYSYFPAQNMATKIPPAMERPNLTKDLPHYMEFLKKNHAKKVGTEKYKDHDCDIYTFIEPNIKKDGKVWVWREKQFPLKIEVNAPEGLTQVELNSIQFDPKIDAATFNLPPTAKIIDLQAMMQAQKNAATHATPPKSPTTASSAAKKKT